MATPAGGGKGPHPFRFAARYAGTCACCGADFAVGTRVEYDPENNLVVVDCVGAQGVPSEAEQAEARAKRCDRCFLVHAKAQEECA